ncbi:MAG: hypothetical protein ACI8RD_006125 [Bacillariaceae sp.]|jgi:hypothetical protein
MYAARKKVLIYLLNYCAMNSNAELIFYYYRAKGDIILNNHIIINTAYFLASEARSQAGVNNK